MSHLKKMWSFARRLGHLAPPAALQVQTYIDRCGKTADDVEDDAIANFMKLLGYSKNVEYRPLIEKVLAVKGISSGVKRHAKYALDKLW